MSITSCDFLNAARRFCVQNDEASLRSVISRAYYAMFHEAMQSLTCVPEYAGNHHGNLIGYMITPAECKGEPFRERDLQGLGYSLKQMRDARNVADYRIMDATVSRDMAEQGISTAERYFTQWANLKSARA
ncbi:hypothetical protein HQN64_19265 [Enterobacteriaceae bacterium BIT-l23]|uniref:hypothetical protein n=1 Tax=Jejubacter sp. L23 TaxID=3092086 RepID=UPI0015858CF4|nr:hypothetical protein [Enterobacteriaceae bacterium BIT-l23]